MPKAKETSNHPCHFLSLPSAKRFWCRHCMSVFEDAITRWRHSRSCRYGVVNNFMRRRQLEAKALQNTTKPNPIEARLEQSVSPSEEPIVEEVPGPSSSSPSSVPSTSAVKTNQATSNDLFRCFICHNKFSTLEEMRHHVKYPCNNKKIITDVPNPAVTVYIDEFTDRSRQWEPQPQTEEVITSEFVPNIVSQETVQSTMEVKSVATQESGGSPNAVNIAPSSQAGNNITPTNIYVNEQGETVIEVENLDLNSEGGELSLAHLLTQLSQQGIVFDKTKASQMQAHHEVATVSDPESGEVYATGTSYDPSARNPVIIKDEDESQSTAEDAANTLAQLAVYRGGYNRVKQEIVADVPHVSVSSDLQRQYVVEDGAGESYTYAESYSIANSTNAHQLNIAGVNQQDIKVEYQYDYLPANHSVTAVSTPQISIQTPDILDASSATAHHLRNIGAIERNIDNVGVESQSVPTTVQIQQNPLHSQVVTYITPSSSSSSAIQHVQTSQGEAETMMIEDFVVEHPGSSQQQYHQGQQHSANISISADGIVHNDESHQQQQQSLQHSNIPTTLLEAGQNSYIVFNTDDNSTQIICNSHASESEINAAAGSITVNSELLENHLREQQQLQQLHQEQLEQQKQQGEMQHQEQYIQSTSEIREHVVESKGTEEFEVQTVTLQEIADTETTDSVTYAVQSHATISSELSSVEASNGAVVASSNDVNHSDSATSTFQPNETISDSCVGDVQLDIQTTNNNIIPASSEASLVSIAVEQHQGQQLSCQMEERTVSLDPETSQPMPVYVVSHQGDLQLVTSSNSLTQQQEQPFQSQ